MEKRREKRREGATDGAEHARKRAAPCRLFWSRGGGPRGGFLFLLLITAHINDLYKRSDQTDIIRGGRLAGGRFPHELGEFRK